jgi:pyruvate dehydrogenase E2 component (dihydrolipoamide acetyltransferase)
MPVEIVMPKLGLTMTEGLIVEWKFEEGERVNKGDILFVLETEKVTFEVEVPETAILAKIIIPKDMTAAIGKIVCYLAQEGEDLSQIEKNIPESAQDNASVSEAPAPSAESVPKIQSGKRIKASPLAKKMARHYQIDLSGVSGTGPGGRIVRVDVEAAHEQQQAGTAGEGMEKIPEVEDRLVPFTGMRRAIAKNMLSSKVETAQTYMTITIDATKIVEYRKTLLPLIAEKHGVRVTITDLVMKITGAAIKEHPVINTRWTDQGVLYLGQVHMGMAMALEEGLIVPVIRNINLKGFAEICRDRNNLIQKGRENKFMPDDISGSTFTVSAMGMFGIEQFTSNINLPESGILAVGAIVDKPVAQNGEVVIRPMMTLTLSYDHRVIDGAEAGKFMRTLKNYMTDPIQIFA